MSDVDPLKWVWRGVVALVLVIGWLFILWQNNFHITVPVVVVGLGYLAVVATLTNLYRVGASAVAPEDASPDAWTRPLGAKGELEREKKGLLKGIKEAEFDQAMGKLSKADADDLINTYRARAIAIIKEIDRIESGEVGTVREQIEREVAARLAVEAVKKKDKKKKKDKEQEKPADEPDAADSKEATS